MMRMPEGDERDYLTARTVVRSGMNDAPTHERERVSAVMVAEVRLSQ